MTVTGASKQSLPAVGATASCGIGAYRGDASFSTPSIKALRQSRK